jgi:hypothetical protein
VEHERRGPDLGISLSAPLAIEGFALLVPLGLTPFASELQKNLESLRISGFPMKSSQPLTHHTDMNRSLVIIGLQRGEKSHDPADGRVDPGVKSRIASFGQGPGRDQIDQRPAQKPTEKSTAGLARTTRVELTP